MCYFLGKTHNSIQLIIFIFLTLVTIKRENFYHHFCFSETSLDYNVNISKVFLESNALYLSFLQEIISRIDVSSEINNFHKFFDDFESDAFIFSPLFA